MHFWAGSTVKTEEVKDVIAYNRANAKMWIVYSLSYFIGGILGSFNMLLGGLIVTFACMPGLIVLVIWYGHIEKKYFVKYK